jgi:MraZ protein
LSRESERAALFRVRPQQGGLGLERTEGVETEIFQGNALNGVDAKARLSVPAFVRSVLDRSSDSRTIFVGKHERADCLTLYGNSYSEYLIGETERRRRLEEEKGAAASALDDQSRGLFGMTEKVVYDVGGRIVLPPMLRSLAGIGDLALFVGQGRFVELWNPETAIKTGGAVLKQIATFYLEQRGAKA